MFRQKTPDNYHQVTVRGKERYSGQTYRPARKEKIRRNPPYYSSLENQKQWDKIHDLVFSLLSLLIPGSISSFGRAVFIGLNFSAHDNVYVYLFWTIFILIIIYASFLFLFLNGGNPKRESSKTFKYLFNIVIYILCFLNGGFGIFVLLVVLLVHLAINRSVYDEALYVFVMGLLLISSWIFSVIALIRYAEEDLRGERQYTDTRYFGSSGTREVLPEIRQSNTSPIRFFWKFSAIAGILLILGSSIFTYFSVKASPHNNLQIPYPSYLPGHGTAALYNSHIDRYWNQDLSVSYPCNFTNDTYIFNNPMSRAMCPISDRTFDNFAIEVQVNILKGNCSDITILYNLSSYTAIDIISCQDYGGGEFAFGNINSETAFETSYPANYQLHDHANLIAFVKIGNAVSVYLNRQLIDKEIIDKEIFKSPNTNFHQGTICLGAETGAIDKSGQTDLVDYKEVKVWIL